MHELWEKILETSISLIILWCEGTLGGRAVDETGDSKFLGLSDRKDLTVSQKHWNQLTRATQGDYAIERKSDASRSYYGGVPATPFIPAFDPLSVLASLAFLAFLLQSFTALFDRTRSLMPTIISSKRSSSEYGEHFADLEKRVLRALDEYANLTNDVLDNNRENDRS